MAEQDKDDQQVGHNSTTIPGGEKDLAGDPGRTPGKAEGEDDSSATDE
jgi:hypothetical protein